MSEGGLVSKLLREAATLAMEDDREEGHDALLLAAEQIANEHGLESPSRKSKSPSRSLELSYSRDASFAHVESAPPFVKLPSQKIATNTGSTLSADLATETITSSSVPAQIDSAETDALALLKSMNVEPLPEPKQSSTVALGDDIQALLDIAVSEGITLNQTHPVSAVKSKPKKERVTVVDANAAAAALAKQKYLTRVQQNRLKGTSLASSLAFQPSGMTAGTISTLPSRLSLLLQAADEKPYGDTLRRQYQTSTQEMLLKNMFLVTNGTQSRRRRQQDSKDKGLNSTAQQEKLLAKFVDDKKHSHYQSDAYDTQPLSARSYRDGPPSIAPSKSQRSQSACRSAMNRLAQPANRTPNAIARKIDPTLNYTTFDDAKEATFRPNLGRRKGSAKNQRGQQDDDDDRKEDIRFGFISRQEADARIRREELAFVQGRADYDAKLNKKVCPQCGAKQSYDEVKEKRKICPNCRVAYGHSLAWNTVSKKFFANMHTYQRRVKEHRERILQEVMREFSTVEMKFVDTKTGKITTQRVERRDKKLNKEEEEEFFLNLKERMAHHEELLKKLGQEVYSELCPFTPTLSHDQSHKKKTGLLEDEDRVSSDEDDYDLQQDGQSNPVKAFMRRYEEDLSLRRLKMPMKYLPTQKFHSKRHENDFDALDGEEEGADKQRLKEEDSSPPRFRF